MSHILHKVGDWVTITNIKLGDPGDQDILKIYIGKTYKITRVYTVDEKNYDNEPLYELDIISDLLDVYYSEVSNRSAKLGLI